MCVQMCAVGVFKLSASLFVFGFQISERVLLCFVRAQFVLAYFCLIVCLDEFFCSTAVCFSLFFCSCTDCFSLLLFCCFVLVEFVSAPFCLVLFCSFSLFWLVLNFLFCCGTVSFVFYRTVWFSLLLFCSYANNFNLFLFFVLFLYSLVRLLFFLFCFAFVSLYFVPLKRWKTLQKNLRGRNTSAVSLIYELLPLTAQPQLHHSNSLLISNRNPLLLKLTPIFSLLWTSLQYYLMNFIGSAYLVAMSCKIL